MNVFPGCGHRSFDFSFCCTLASKGWPPLPLPLYSNDSNFIVLGHFILGVFNFFPSVTHLGKYNRLCVPLKIKSLKPNQKMVIFVVNVYLLHLLIINYFLLFFNMYWAPVAQWVVRPTHTRLMVICLRSRTRPLRSVLLHVPAKKLMDGNLKIFINTWNLTVNVHKVSFVLLYGVFLVQFNCIDIK